MVLSEAVVFIVDDDVLIRDSLEQLVKSVGLRVEIFLSAQDFLDFKLPDSPCCLVLDIRMPGMSGLDLQDELQKRTIDIPVVFITGHGTVPMSVRAMKSGAIDFIQKPFEDQQLLDVIHHAIENNKHVRQGQSEKQHILKCLSSLTPRENEILALVVAGKLNKQIAHELNMSENTVKTHRARIMRKMEVDSLASLVRSTEKSGVVFSNNSRR